ncbi:YveK family protein [Ignavigranum ruoffiae]|uniref:Capsular polysaccharide biosynthesis protein CpsC n=1 Tax=Ignavigranum ruoffiae TaxID=89093 RepID=A0A1H9CN07_9LACT|nr:Wzz/FepE/Etk N-terminal domain-containing protein [Ignavigranum ruoffiae]UPQ86646.1 Wzz/FepE/Etk N-terminal domain-containing protein [Ignavigranum ruoffiae]SEQ02549.1 Capsular polysaccharide biosynthesis protein [Ignavigranum ruoffiae]
MQEELSLLELFKVLKKHIFMILISMILGAGLSSAFMIFFVDEIYKSEAQLIVNQNSNIDKEVAAVQYNDLQTSISLINTYSDIIKSQSLLQEVSNSLNNEISVPALRQNLTVEQSPDSQSFMIKANLGSPDLAQRVVATVTEKFIDVLPKIYQDNTTNVYVLSDASYNSDRVSPSLFRYIVIGAILGLLLSLIMVFIREINDNTIRNEDFLMSIGLVNLGEVNRLSKDERKHARLGQQMSRKFGRRKG